MRPYLFLAAAVAALIGLLAVLRGPEMFTFNKLAGPPLDTRRVESAVLGAPPASDPAGEEPKEIPKVPTIHYSSDPSTRPPEAELTAAAEEAAPEKRASYGRALAELEVIGCNANGSFSVKTGAPDGIRLLHSGEAVHFKDGLILVAKLTGYPQCHVALYDGRVKVADRAAF